MTILRKTPRIYAISCVFVYQFRSSEHRFSLAKPRLNTHTYGWTTYAMGYPGGVSGLKTVGSRMPEGHPAREGRFMAFTKGGGKLRDSSRKVLAVLLALGLVFSVMGAYGCKKAEDPATPPAQEPAEDPAVDKVGGVLKYFISEPAYIDPFNTQESEGTQVTQMLFDSLTTIDYKTSEVIPAAAASWEPNEDATVWTFKLVEGATFHDGTPVTAGDFKYAWERIVNPATNPEDPSVISYHLSAVEGFAELEAGTATELEGVKVVDDNTLEVTLSAPFADFEFVVAHPALAPISKAAVDADPAAFAQKPIGNGPFKMVEPWAHDQYIKVERFDDYYGEKALLDGIDYLIFKDEETAFREFEAGNLDFVSIPTGRVDEMKTTYGESADGYTVQPGKQVLTGAETAIYYMLMNTKDAALNNVKMREAVSMAINRQAICDTLFEGTRQPATGIIPPGIVGFQADAWAASKYDVEAAKAALAEAGFPEGKGAPKLTLSFNTGVGHEDIMQLIQADLAAIGIESDMGGVEWAQYLKQLDAGSYQIGRLGWIADYPIMDNFLYALFESNSGDNKSFITIPEFDSGVLAARKITDDADRVKAYQDLEKIVGDETPVAPIMFYAHRHVGSERVNDLTYSANGLASLDSAWLTK